jgi:hypothetical protein
MALCQPRGKRAARVTLHSNARPGAPHPPKAWDLVGTDVRLGGSTDKMRQEAESRRGRELRDLGQDTERLIP